MAGRRRRLPIRLSFFPCDSKAASLMPVIEKINAFHYRLWSRIPADMLTYLSRHSRVSTIAFCITLFVGLTAGAQTTILQPLADKPVPGSAVKLKSDFYVPVTPETVRWGSLPDHSAKPVLTVRSGPPG